MHANNIQSVTQPASLDSLRDCLIFAIQAFCPEKDHWGRLLLTCQLIALWTTMPRRRSSVGWRRIASAER
eukprot:3894939-Amphidinium_carterae.1